MKFGKLFICTAALCAGTTILSAQETNEVQQLKQMMQQMQENFQKERNEDRQVIRSLSEKVEELLKEKQTRTAVTSAPPATTTAPTEAVTPQKFKELDEKVDHVVEAQKKTLMSEFNPSIGLVGETIFSYNSKASDQTGSDRPGGFDVNQRSIELNIAASVDPFAKGYAVINASADSATGEANMTVEEAAIQTTSLPWNLELKAGRFFGEFGRLSYIHDHELPFVNRPLVLDQYVGGESKTDGLQLNWLFPTAHYISLAAGLGDQFGDVPNNAGTYRSFAKVNYWGRLSTYFELSPNWQLDTGVSGFINPTTGDLGGAMVQPNGVSTETEKQRRFAGVDVKLSYVPLQNNQFRSFTWGTEALYSDSRFLFDPNGSLNPANTSPGLDGDEFEGNVGSWGLYSYMTYKWSRQWSGGFLFEYVQNDQNNQNQTYAYSPYLTFALSHWNQLRLQYTHTDPNSASGLQASDAVYMQWTWIIGAHSHGWAAR